MMSKAVKQATTRQEHSAGPWAFTEGDAEKRAMSDVYKASDKEFRIAWVTCDWFNVHQRAEDIANARLISAAPELLAACRQALETMNTGAYAEPACRALEVAIAKATGK